jgi:hypothetical protein
VGFCEDDNEPSGYTKYGEFLNRSATTSFSRVALLHEGKSHFMSSNKLLYRYAVFKKTDSIKLRTRRENGIAWTAEMLM